MTKKILFVVPALEGGGAEKILIDLLNGIPRHVFETGLIVFNKSGSCSENIPTNTSLFNLNKKDRFDFLRLVFKFARIVQQEKPDLIVTFLTYANYLCLVAKALFRLRPAIIVAEHSIVSRVVLSRAPFIKSLLVRLFYPRASRVITVSDGCSEELVRYFGVPEKKLSVIYNGIDIGLVRTLGEEKIDHPWFADQVPILISVGRLSKGKNHALLLHALSLLRSRMAVRLIIVGEGEELERLKLLARNLSLQDDVWFAGFQRNPYKYLSRSKVFVSTSNYESFSIVILEAMSLGIPVVATDCPFGPREIISNRYNGILTRPNDSHQLSFKIDEVLNDQQLYAQLVAEGMRRASEFTLQQTNEKYLQLFQFVLDEIKR